jgi:hypothetical protein
MGSRLIKKTTVTETQEYADEEDLGEDGDLGDEEGEEDTDEDEDSDDNGGEVSKTSRSRRKK